LKTLPKKFLSLEVGRFLASLFVVFFHVNVATSEAKYFKYHAIPFFAGGFSGVEFFFVLSGFVIFMAHSKDLENKNSKSAALNFLWKRFMRLYPAIWGVLIILIPLIFCVKNLQWRGPISLFDIFSALAITPVVGEKILAVEWSLRYEVMFYLLFAVTVWRRIWGTAIWSLLIGLSFASFWLRLDGIAGFFVTPYPLLFVAGALIGYSARNQLLRLAFPALFTGSAIFLWRVAICAEHPSNGGSTLWDTAFFGIGATFIIYGLVVLEARRSVNVPAWLQYLGGASYAIYLVHFPLVSLGAKLAMKLRPYHISDVALMMFIAAFAVAGGIVYHELAEKPLLAYLRRFSPKKPELISV
jgi:exopolysaccharide production protein ExoZ